MGAFIGPFSIKWIEIGEKNVYLAPDNKAKQN